MRGATASGKGADALDADLPRAVSALLEPMQAALLERTLSRAAGKNGQMLSALHETMARLQGTLEQMPGLKNPALDSERAQRFQSELNAQAREREQLAAGEVQLDQDRQQLHQALVDGPAHGTVNVRARDLEQRLDELGDQIRRMHTRLALLSDAILSAPAAQSH